MTRDSDFKKRVRARMLQTGQNYTAARADIIGALQPSHPQGTHPPEESVPSGWEAARAEHDRVVSRFIIDGVMVTAPQKRKARASVLLHLVSLFEVGRSYSEREVNDVLVSVHEDFAFWRRELVDYGYLTRERGIYRLAVVPPERPSWMAQEIPAWESLWLPRYLGGEITE